jgi:tetraacyldisaccharide 4'-kinase
VSVAEFVRERAWKRDGAAGRLAALGLRPLSWLFRGAVGLRNFAYWSGLAPTRRAAIPVVSVGNLTVGGTGKTPFALWLARRLQARGARVALVSRGYGGSAAGVTVVSTGGGLLVGPDVCGDEPAMMARGFCGVVVTAARRIDAVNEAARLGCEIAVLDDGFQHRALARDFDIVLDDGTGGAMLPAGPLRESRRALRRADAVVLTPAADAAAVAGSGLPSFRLTYELTGLVESVGGEWQERPCGRLAGKRVVAVVGIANPERFYAMIRHWDAEIVDVFEYPDHHAYTRSDWQEISRRSQDCDLLVTTEKDLVKLEAFPFARGMLMALRVEPRLADGERLLAMIEDATLLRDVRHVATARGLGYAGSQEERTNGHQ